MDVVCILGERVYHAPGSQCHRELAERGPLLTLSEGQAQEVGMEPCGFCLGQSPPAPPNRQSG